MLDGSSAMGGAANEAAALHERLQQLHRELRRHFAMDRLLGDSAVMARVRSQVRLAAASEATVLVVGQPGSGRQHVGRAIHDDRPAEQIGTFLPLSCEVLSAELLLDTRGAIGPAAGRCQTDGELIAERCARASAGSARRIGGDVGKQTTLAPHHFDLRFAAGRLGRRGSIPRDLAHALSTVVIHLPSLAERPADIPLLAQMFLEELNAAQGERTAAKQLRGFSSEALDQLAAYAWPGNIDELASIVRQAYDKAEGQEITPGDLPQQIYLAAHATRHGAARRSRSPWNGFSPISKAN